MLLYHHDSHDQLRTHLVGDMAACNVARRLKALSGLTPYEFTCRIWALEPDRFIQNSIYQMLELNYPGAETRAMARKAVAAGDKSCRARVYCMKRRRLAAPSKGRKVRLKTGASTAA